MLLVLLVALTLMSSPQTEFIFERLRRIILIYAVLTAVSCCIPMHKVSIKEVIVPLLIFPTPLSKVITTRAVSFTVTVGAAAIGSHNLLHRLRSTAFTLLSSSNNRCPSSFWVDSSNIIFIYTTSAPRRSSSLGYYTAEPGK